MTKNPQVYEKGSSQGGDLQTKGAETTQREAEQGEGRALGRESSQTPRKPAEEMTAWICMWTLCFLAMDLSWEGEHPQIMAAPLQPVLSLSCRHPGGRGRSLPGFLVAVGRIRARALSAG